MSIFAGICEPNLTILIEYGQVLKKIPPNIEMYWQMSMNIGEYWLMVQWGRYAFVLKCMKAPGPNQWDYKQKRYEHIALYMRTPFTQ